MRTLALVVTLWVLAAIPGCVHSEAPEGPKVLITEVHPPAWTYFKEYAPRAIMRLSEHYDLPLPKIQLEYGQPLTYLGPLGHEWSIRGMYSDGLIWIFMQSSDNFNELRQILLHEWLHYWDDMTGVEAPTGRHNAIFRKRIADLDLVTVAGR